MKPETEVAYRAAVKRLEQMRDAARAAAQAIPDDVEGGANMDHVRARHWADSIALDIAVTAVRETADSIFGPKGEGNA